jgi:exopolysaccharide production protein ExoQ
MAEDTLTAASPPLKATPAVEPSRAVDRPGPVEIPRATESPRRNAPHPAATAPPVWQQVSTWLLFWPLLCLIARQAPYLSGPARDTFAYQNAALTSGAHASNYLGLLSDAIFAALALANYNAMKRVLADNRLILAALLLPFASCLWSSSVKVSLQMSIAVSSCSLFACYLTQRFTPQALMKLLMFMGLVSALLSTLFAVALPSYGIFVGYQGGAWQGITDHKNTLGLTMAFLLLPTFFVDGLSRNRKLLYASLLLFLIYKSQSRGAWLDTAAVLALIAGLSLARRLRRQDLLFALSGTLVFTLLLATFLITYGSALMAGMGKDPTMSGRTGIYAEVWHSILKHPLLGYGLGAFWSQTSPEAYRIRIAIGWMTIGYSESGILEVALQFGLLGIVLLCLLVGRALRQAIRLLRSPFYTPQTGWYLSILALLALSNVDAGWFFTVNTLDWVLLLVACIGINRESQRSRLRIPRRPSIYGAAHPDLTWPLDQSRSA